MRNFFPFRLRQEKDLREAKVSFLFCFVFIHLLLVGRFMLDTCMQYAERGDVESNLIGDWEWLINMFFETWILTLNWESTKSKVVELRNLNKARRLIWMNCNKLFKLSHWDLRPKTILSLIVFFNMTTWATAACCIMTVYCEKRL